jgi:hypothetical protein
MGRLPALSCYGGDFLFEIELSRPSANQIDFNQRVIGEGGDADAGAGAELIGREIVAIGRVHRRVVFSKARQIDPRRHDVFETKIESGQHQPQVFHHAAGLRLDAVGQLSGRIWGRVDRCGTVDRILERAFPSALSLHAPSSLREMSWRKILGDFLQGLQAAFLQGDQKWPSRIDVPLASKVASLNIA